jgi:DNA polymerase II large subunit
VTMFVLQSFLAGGTQVRLELPGKGGVVVPVDSIEPPVVRLRDGSVVRVDSDVWPSVRDKIERVLFLGDMLISFGDFLYNNKSLGLSGYTKNGGLLTLEKGFWRNMAETWRKPQKLSVFPRIGF